VRPSKPATSWPGFSSTSHHRDGGKEVFQQQTGRSSFESGANRAYKHPEISRRRRSECAKSKVCSSSTM
jgi:hypothetical protein